MMLRRFSSWPAALTIIHAKPASQQRACKFCSKGAMSAPLATRT